MVSATLGHRLPRGCLAVVGYSTDETAGLPRRSSLIQIPARGDGFGLKLKWSSLRITYKMRNA